MVTIPSLERFFSGGGAVFAQTTECAPNLGTAPDPITIHYSPSESNGRASDVSIVWRDGSGHLALFGAMLPSPAFQGGAGRQTFSLLVFCPKRRQSRVVQRQVTQPPGAELIDADEMVLRLRVQRFGAQADCAASIAATLRRQ